MFHLNASVCARACRAQMGQCWVWAPRAGWEVEGGVGWEGAAGSTQGSFMSTCILLGPHYTDADEEAFRG